MSGAWLGEVLQTFGFAALSATVALLWRDARRESKRFKVPDGTADEDAVDTAYVSGKAQVWREVLALATQGLGATSRSRTREQLLLERADTIAALRSVCEDFGDNDWDPSLHLADVVEKHLARHLHQKEPNSGN